MLRLSKRRPAAAHQRPPRVARRVRLELEELESRTVPTVLTPLQVRHAYGFDQLAFTVNGRTIAGDGSGQTIAIINAYNQPHIVSDLDTFDRTFSINNKQPLYQQYGAASSFLTVVNPQGTPLADPSGGLWNLETSLDVEWAHAIAPGAKILLVQARTGGMLDLLGAIDYARKTPGVVAVSMSWGAGEFPSETYYDKYFTTPSGHLGGSNGIGGTRIGGGVTFLAAAGDAGAPGLWPAMSPYVVAVGGTTLTVDSAGVYKSETAWGKSGGGSSKYESKPGYQVGFVSSTMRGTPDVAYNGDPATGVYVYDSMPLNGRAGSWWAVGGTSAGTPQWAGLVAIADQARALLGRGSLDGPSQTLPALYAMATSDFHDVTSGSNGFSAKVGYDLVTGRGSPIAPRVVTDLVRAGSKGALTLTLTSGGTKLALAPAIKPSLFVTATGLAPDAAADITPGLSGGDIVAVLLRDLDRTTPTSPPVTSHVQRESAPPHPLQPEPRAIVALFANGIDWLGADDGAPDVLPPAPVAPDDMPERDAYFAQ
ncbi:hypothetical protein AYO44_00695 [Planctomycetaceae bacterium SCGC AG-212-F19]|nr:hypothetical protein AYO44_00695 [Planctomycetaceae bacterium SCGC AG-212-F19]